MKPKRKHARGALLTRNGHVVRPNRLARGMNETSERSNHSARLSIAALSLAVNGTTDALTAFRMLGRTEQTTRRCPCCGIRLPYKVLNASGRRRLQNLREGIFWTVDIHPHDGFKQYAARVREIESSAT